MHTEVKTINASIKTSKRAMKILPKPDKSQLFKVYIITYSSLNSEVIKLVVWHTGRRYNKLWKLAFKEDRKFPKLSLSRKALWPWLFLCLFLNWKGSNLLSWPTLCKRCTLCCSVYCALPNASLLAVCNATAIKCMMIQTWHAI